MDRAQAGDEERALLPEVEPPACSLACVWAEVL